MTEIDRKEMRDFQRFLLVSFNVDWMLGTSTCPGKQCSTVRLAELTELFETISEEDPGPASDNAPMNRLVYEDIRQSS